MLKLNRMTAVAAIAAIGLAAAPLATSAQQPTVQSEQAAHPRIVASIHSMEAAYKTLADAPDNFGGNKAQAMADLHQAIHSLKKALYFRLHMDDATIDRY